MKQKTEPFSLILKNISRFIALDKSETELFVSLLKQKTFKKKEFILRQGEICRFEIFVTNGCLKSFTVDQNGFEHVLLFAVEDWWIGDLQSFINNTPATFFIQALEDTDVLLLSDKNIEKLYTKIPKFERYFRILFQKSLITQFNRINLNIEGTAEERYLAFVKKYPQWEQRISQKNVAAFLGITPVFLSMLRRKLTRK